MLFICKLFYKCFYISHPSFFFFFEMTILFLHYVFQVGRLENVIGWYHSHPGYGCWLSGIDVSTQMLNQQFQEPFVAIVVSLISLYKFLVIIPKEICIS